MAFESWASNVRAHAVGLRSVSKDQDSSKGRAGLLSRVRPEHEHARSIFAWFIHAAAADSEQLLQKWTLQTINSSNTIHFVCDLGLQSHHAVDVIGLHGLVWSEGSETSVSYDLLLLLPGTFATVCPRAEHADRHILVPSRVDRQDES